MSRQETPVTSAIRVLRAAKVDFSGHSYNYVEKGGTAVSARELGVSEHVMVKTLIMENDQRIPLVMLMHGDLEVSTKELARTLGVKSVSPCTPEMAHKYTGYLVGGTSPFGTRRVMPVYMEETILDLPKIFINGGKRGFLVKISPSDLVELLEPTLVTVVVHG